MFDDLLKMLLQVVGGLGIFMLGMKFMSEGMQAVAGNALRRMISLVTGNRLLATGTGTAVTLLVQSSTVATVIVVGLVNAGLMQLKQAVGVIMGTNIGTTITGWVLVLKLGQYGLPLLGLAALVYIFARRDRIRFIAMALMGLGMIFFGLELMKDGVYDLREAEWFQQAFKLFAADNYFGIFLCVILGCVLTFMVQSSSATLGITISLASTGAIPFDTALAVVLGSNVGTTITVMIAAIGANTSARRTAYAHVIFNLVGALWMAILLPLYLPLIQVILEAMYGMGPAEAAAADPGDSRDLRTEAMITAGIAITHTTFNVVNTILFLPFLAPFVRLLIWLAPDPRTKEVSRLRHLDARAVDAPVLGVEQSRGEVVQMGRGVVKMAEWTKTLAFNGPPDEKLVQKTYNREQILDNMEREIVAFLTDVLDGTVPHSVAEEGRQQLRIAHEYESSSDLLSTVLKNYLRLRERKLELSAEQRRNLEEVHEKLIRYLRHVSDAYENRRRPDDKWVLGINGEIKDRIKHLREEHINQLVDSSMDPGLSMIYTSLLTDYRRITAHARNVYDAIVGTKARPVD